MQFSAHNAALLSQKLDQCYVRLKDMGEGRYSSTHSYTQHYVQVSGTFHSLPTSSPEKRAPVGI